MPTVKDKTTGDVVSRQPYTAEGTQRAEQIAESDPTWEIDYAPGGKQDAPSMREQMYAGGGKVGYNKIGMYKKGGKADRKRKKPAPLTQKQQNVSSEALKWKSEIDKKWKEGKISTKDYQHKKNQILRGMDKAGIPKLKKGGKTETLGQLTKGLGKGMPTIKEKKEGVKTGVSKQPDLSMKGIAKKHKRKKAMRKFFKGMKEYYGKKK